MVKLKKTNGEVKNEGVTVHRVCKTYLVMLSEGLFIKHERERCLTGN